VPGQDVIQSSGKRNLGGQSESSTAKKFKHITIPL
jgi:hypothetical protein